VKTARPVERVSEVVRRALGPTLTEAGFKRRALCFRRMREGAVDLVEARLDAYDAASLGRFMLGFGVFLPAVAEILGERRRYNAPKEAESTFHVRAGPMANRDPWWTVNPATPGDEATADVLATFRARGEPFLALASDLQALHRALDEDRTIVADDPLAPAALALVVGDHAAASARIARAVEAVDQQHTRRNVSGDRFGTLLRRRAEKLVTIYRLAPP
jgi:hypothetical protein